MRYTGNMQKSMRYDHKVAEEKWQRLWKKTNKDTADIKSAKKPFYNLMMFPYPSAEGLHVGNMYAFTGSDIHGRFKRMQGYDVFEPIGLDGFGIHSENYALKVGRHPMDHAKRTQKNFYAQLGTIGAMLDWTRTVETYDTDYYRWTQWLFVQMFKHGLAYRGSAQVNWCPSCKTVLADEQVINGMCERCGNKVEKRPLEQWFFRITAYAEKLLQNSFSLDWSEKIRVAQQHWIGKKQGINITYPVVDEKGVRVGEVTCFTTRPDTNFGASFVVVSPEHKIVTHIEGVLKNKKTVAAIKKYCIAASKKTEEERIAESKEKTGIATGLYCVNELSGERMPLYVSDFVLAHVGTGAVVGVPGHDARDFAFAHAFNLPVKRVVVGPDRDTSEIASPEQVFEGAGTIVNSDFLNGLPTNEAIQKVTAHLKSKGWGEPTVAYHLRDWIISRQRYWGPPIPMIYCETCRKAGRGERADAPGWWTVPEEDLPVVLPRIEDYKPGDDGVAPLAKHKEFYKVICPNCKAEARRETDVSDTFLDSSWYFLRYPSVGSPGAKRAPFDPAITKKWLPVSMYTGGAEHSVLHLMYSRFITMALHDWGFVSFDEPFPHFYAHGLVIKDGAKMSKSRGNVVTPDEYIALYGADALRLYLMFMGPFSEGGDFRETAMEGMARWVGRLWRMAQESIDAPASKNAVIETALHKLIQKIGDDFEKRRYNTAIAAMMEFTNLVLGTNKRLDPSSLKTFILLLAPLAPHLSEELWTQIQKISDTAYTASKSVHVQAWPSYNASRVVDETVTLIVQVNGKLRDRLILKTDFAKDKSQVERLVQKSSKVTLYIAGKKVKQVIFVAGRLINFVI
jgi:leucyl-tRNA synthetase